MGRKGQKGGEEEKGRRGDQNLLVLGFSVGIEVFDELLSINVPCSQEFSGVLRIWT